MKFDLSLPKSDIVIDAVNCQEVSIPLHCDDNDQLRLIHLTYAISRFSSGLRHLNRGIYT